jgi:hypothetical protein
MIKIMAHENMEEWGNHFSAVMDTVRAVVEAFGAGQIALFAVAKLTRTDRIRYAPSFIQGGNGDRDHHYAYSALTIAKFIGWTEPDGDAKYNKVTLALSAFALSEEAHHFVTTCCPEFREKTLGVVQEEKRKYEAQTTSRGERKTSENLPMSAQETRADHNDISVRSQRWLDRLSKDHESLFEQVQRRELSPYKAACMAGLTRPPTPGQLLRRAWNKATHAEKDAFMTWANEQGW